MTAKELENGKEQLKGNLMLSLESTNSRMSRNGKNELLLKKHRSLDEIIEEISADEDIKLSDVKETLQKLVKEEVRRLITVEKIRPDGRAIDEIRALSSQVTLLPRTHGSGLFTRGQTQALSIY